MWTDRLKFLFRSGWEYYRNAKTIYDIDSPFLFQLTKSLFDKSNHPTIYQRIEDRRNELKKDHSVFEKKDLGHGSLHSAPGSSEINLSTWVSHSSISPYYGRILNKLVCHMQPRAILELGAAAGISGAYLASGICTGSFITIEGDPMAANLAKRTFEKLSIHIAHVIQGSFEEKLDQVISENPPDLIFIDGNHQSKAVKRYIDSVLTHLPGGIVVIIVDDIRWNEDMYMAWKALAKDQRWQLSIDLFRIGLLIRNEDMKDHQAFKIIESKFKPWHIGLTR